MSTKSFTSLLRFCGSVLLLVCGAYSIGANAQATTPPVTASSSMGFSHPSGWGTIQQTALDTYGDWLVVDFPNGALYELPAGSTSFITLAAPGVVGNIGGFDNPGIAVDSNNNLYIEANFNNCLLMFPYDTATKTWDGLATLSTTNTTQTVCPNAGGGTSPYIFAQYGLTIAGAYPGYYQPWALAIDANNNLIVGSQNSGNFIMTLSVVGSGASAKVGPGQMVLDTLTKRPISVAVDKSENIFFVEDSGGLPGVYEIPAGSPELTADTDPTIVRVDPNLPNVTGVTTDASGNLYISDGTDGVFFVPNVSGTITPAAAILLSPIPAEGEVAPDFTHNILFVPTTQTQSNGQADVAEVAFNAAQFGAATAGTSAAASQSVLFGFNAAETPGSFVVQEAGVSNPDFTVGTTGTCAAGTAYAAQSGCSVAVTLNPHSAGNVSAKLLMLDASGNTLSSLDLQGVGTGSSVQILPGTESTFGSGLKTPSQIAVDAAGNTYVADSGLGVVEMFPKGSSTGTSVGTGLTAPTGVAVDGAGDVYIADSGNVLEIPYGSTGLNAAGQVTVRSGLGNNLKLAADGLNDLYISDPDNQRVVKLANLGGSAIAALLSQTETDLTGFNSPSALTLDSSNNLYVADGSNLIEVTPAGAQSTVLSSLSGATGLATDPSGAVYVAEPSGTLRIPSVSGTLTASAATTVAPDVTNPTSVAVDSSGNVYIADGTAEDVTLVSVDASYDFGSLSSTSGTAAQNFTVLNNGNATLNLSGFGSTADYSETATTCGSTLDVGATCSATLTFNPGAGDQGLLSAQIPVQGDEANSPVTFNVSGTGAALANSVTTAVVGSATVDGVPVTVTVAPASGTSPVPTGNVTLTVSGNGLTAPIVTTAPLSNGTVQFDQTQLAAGSYSFAFAYEGDRVYGTSNTAANVTVAAGAVVLSQPTMDQIVAANPTYPYVLSDCAQCGSQQSYDGSAVQFEYKTFTVYVSEANGAPLVGQPVYLTDSKTGEQTLEGYNYGSVSFQGATPTCTPQSVQLNTTTGLYYAQLDTTCLAIDIGNNEIPDLETAYSVTPVYSPAGGASWPGSTTPDYTMASGTPVSFTALRNPVVQISSNPSSLTVSSGSSATATLTLTSVLGYGFMGSGGKLNNYNLPVQLSCDGLPAYTTCSFTYPTPDSAEPQSVDVGPNPGTVLSYQNATAAPCTAAQGCFGPGTVIMTITTDTPTGQVASLHRSPSSVVFAAMLGFGVFGFAFGRRKSLRNRIGTLACLMICFGILGSLSGCSTKQLGVGTITPTPAGTYNVTVTAKQVGSTMANNNGGIVYGNSNQVSLPFTINVTVN